jgi:hypothetical protein
MGQEPVDGTLGGVVALAGVVVGVVGFVVLVAGLVLLDDVVSARLEAFRVVALGLGTPVGSARLVLRGFGFGFAVGLCVVSALDVGSTVGAAARCWSW